MRDAEEGDAPPEHEEPDGRCVDVDEVHCGRLDYRLDGGMLMLPRSFFKVLGIESPWERVLDQSGCKKIGERHGGCVEDEEEHRVYADGGRVGSVDDLVRSRPFTVRKLEGGGVPIGGRGERLWQVGAALVRPAAARVGERVKGLVESHDGAGDDHAYQHVCHVAADGCGCAAISSSGCGAPASAVQAGGNDDE